MHAAALAAAVAAGCYLRFLIFCTKSVLSLTGVGAGGSGCEAWSMLHLTGRQHNNPMHLSTHGSSQTVPLMMCAARVNQCVEIRAADVCAPAPALRVSYYAVMWSMISVLTTTSKWYRETATCKHKSVLSRPTVY